jgi:Scaffold protein Nfu/NifU N terminal
MPTGGGSGVAVTDRITGRSRAELVIATCWHRPTTPVDGTAEPTERAYDRRVANATPAPTPNPDAMKFTLDTTLKAMFNATAAEEAAAIPFAADVFAAGGVASVFGVNDFVTVTRQAGADWGPIMTAVRAAAEAHL